MATRREKIVEKGLELLDGNPDGLRYSALVKEILKTMPEVPVNTIHGTVWDLDVQQSSKIYKPSRGLYRLIKFKPDDSGALPLEPVAPKPKLAIAVRIRNGDGSIFLNRTVEINRTVPFNFTEIP